MLRRGQVVGHTCSECPKYDEPIRRMVNGAGVRFRVTVDRAPDPTTGKRRQVSRLFDTVASARQGLATLSAEVEAMDEAEADPAPAPAPVLTVGDACDRFLTAKGGKVRGNTLESFRFDLARVRRFMGDRDVTTLQPTDVEAFATWLTTSGNKGKPYSSHAARGSLARLSAVLDRLHKVERVTRENVYDAADVRLPSSSSVMLVEDDEDGSDDLLERWSEAEWRTFVRHADSDDLAVGWRLLALGLRREEVLGLRWSDVDFDRKEIRIRQTRVQVSTDTDPRGWTFGAPKSKASRRTIRPDSVLPGTMDALRKTRGVGVALVVVDETGEPPAPRWFSRRFGQVCKAAGVPVIHAHSTRHTLAYFMSDAGIPPVNAAAFLGHTTQVFTNIYLRHKVEGVEAAEAALGTLFAKAAEA